MHGHLNVKIGDTAPVILNIGTRWRRVARFMRPQLQSGRKNDWEVGWNLEPVWTLRKRDKFLAPVWNKTATHRWYSP